MTVETVTVGELLDRLAFRIEGRNAQDAVMRPNYLWALQSVMREVVLDLDLETFRAQAVLTFLNGTSDYALADDFRRFIEPSLVFTDSSKWTVWETNHQDYDRLGGSLAFSGKSRPTAFMFLGIDATTGKYMIRSVPTPDATYPARYRYFAFPARIDLDTDGTTVIDRRFQGAYKDALVAGALLNFPERITPQEVQVASRTFEVWKRTIRRNNRSSIGGVFRRKPAGTTMGERRFWTGSGMFGSPWNGGSSGPI